MRADRLLSLLLLLQTHGRMTAHDLAEQLEVSERTIYRDLEALGMAGIPVYTERGPGGGCSLIDGYQTKLTGLTESEVRALFLFSMASPLKDLGLGKALDDALLKLSAALPLHARTDTEQLRQRFHLDTTWWYHHEDTTSYLDLLQEAVWHERRVCLRYHEDNDTWFEHLVEPYGLVAKAGVWYLIGMVMNTAEVFRVSRIQAVELLPEQFQRLNDFDLAHYWAEYRAERESQRPQYTTSLRVAPDEIEMLPRRLSEAGYMLVESAELDDTDDITEVDAPAVSIPYRQQKKEPSPLYSATRSTRITGQQQKKKLYQRAMGRSLGQQKKEKTNFLSKKEPMPARSSKKTPMLAHPSKKTDMYGLSQKKRLNSTKKTHFNIPTKKAFPAHLAASVPLCA